MDKWIVSLFQNTTALKYQGDTIYFTYDYTDMGRDYYYFNYIFAKAVLLVIQININSITSEKLQIFKIILFI